MGERERGGKWGGEGEREGGSGEGGTGGGGEREKENYVIASHSDSPSH